MAKFKAAAVFSSNMVLQREKNVRVFGTGKKRRKRNSFDMHKQSGNRGSR